MLLYMWRHSESSDSLHQLHILCSTNTPIMVGIAAGKRLSSMLCRETLRTRIHKILTIDTVVLHCLYVTLNDKVTRLFTTFAIL